MAKDRISLIFDRRKKAGEGDGALEICVRLEGTTRKYISVGKCTRRNLSRFSSSRAVVAELDRVRDIVNAMRILGEEMTLQNLNRHLGIEEKEEDGPVDFLRFSRNELAAMDVSAGTRKQRRVALDALEEWGRMRMMKDVTPENINRFYLWLHNGERSDVTVYGYMKRVHVFVRAAMYKGLIERDPFDAVKMKVGKSKARQPLDESDLEKIIALPLIGFEARCRDLFIFCAFTGLSYVDSQVFDEALDVVTVEGNEYISSERIKTGTKYFTPLLAPARVILNRYGGPLRICYNDYNKALHVIGAAAGVSKPMSTHVARHTFATTVVLSHGVPIESLSRMLGHTNIRTTQIYAKIMDTKVARDASVLFTKNGPRISAKPGR